MSRCQNSRGLYSRGCRRAALELSGYQGVQKGANTSVHIQGNWTEWLSIPASHSHYGRSEKENKWIQTWVLSGSLSKSCFQNLWKIQQLWQSHSTGEQSLTNSRWGRDSLLKHTQQYTLHAPISQIQFSVQTNKEKKKPQKIWLSTRNFIPKHNFGGDKTTDFNSAAG